MKAHRSPQMTAAILAGLFLSAAMTLPNAAHAGESVTFIVDSTADIPDADTADGSCNANAADPASPECTLRAAIMQGNATPLAKAVDIRLTGGEHYTVSGADSVNDTSGSAGDLEISRPMDIRSSPSTNPATVTGVGVDRLFDIRAGAAGTTISALSLNNVSVSAGCILSTQQGAGALTLDHIEISNSVCGSQGALYLTSTPTTIRSSNIHHGNRVLWSVAGVVTIERSTFHANTDLPNLVFIGGSVANVIDSTFSGNYRPLTASNSELYVTHSTFTDSESGHIAFKTSTPTKNGSS